MPKMELDKPAKAEPAELRTQDRANPQNRDQTNLYDTARAQSEARLAARAQAEPLAPAMAPAAPPPTRARTQRQAELTPVLRQNHLKNEIDRVNARVANIDKRLEPDKVREAAKSMGAEMASQARLQQVLDNPIQREAMRNILVTDYTTESFAFLEAVEDYRRNPTREGFIAIHDQFVTVGAPAEVNIASTQRGPLHRQLGTVAGLPGNAPTDPSLFDVAHQEVFNLVAGQVLDRVKRRPEFLAACVEVCSTGIPNDLKAQKTALLAEKKVLQRELTKARVDGVKNFLGFGRSK